VLSRLRYRHAEWRGAAAGETAMIRAIAPAAVLLTAVLCGMQESVLQKPEMLDTHRGARGSQLSTGKMAEYVEADIG